MKEPQKETQDRIEMIIVYLKKIKTKKKKKKKKVNQGKE